MKVNSYLWLAGCRSGQLWNTKIRHGIWFLNQHVDESLLLADGLCLLMLRDGWGRWRLDEDDFVVLLMVNDWSWCYILLFWFLWWNVNLIRGEERPY